MSTVLEAGLTNTDLIFGEGARMNGNATQKLNEANDALIHQIDFVYLAITRIADIQIKLSQCLDECLAEFHELCLVSQNQGLNLTGHYENRSPHFAHGLSWLMRNDNETTLNQ